MDAHLCHTVRRTAQNSFLRRQERALTDLEAPISFQHFRCKKMNAAAQQFFIIHDDKCRWARSEAVHIRRQ